ncbi:DUF4387 domain-containing protein [Plantactinospora mayteni]|uniref:Acyl-CoA synthetase n=1 Tax=Plantactinospora mayteni TaxID=566021 RepID=A0ABQ4EY51_9ACTN|nr:DUF4387 family protein [Plantactinospora mayteni]GIG99561.1 acyl-CoA synthetase [Plantactinospora mayteni]
MRLYECADIIRSKNAGPFTLTIDLFFGDEERYSIAKGSTLLTVAGVAQAYGVEESRVKGVYFDDRIRAAKVSLLRWSSSTDPFCADMFGAHLHTPLADGELVPARSEGVPE